MNVKKIEAFTCTDKGDRPYQEDSIIKYKNGNVYLVGVFDGHSSINGGAQISQSLVEAYKNVVNVMTSELFKHPKEFENFLEKNAINIDKWLLAVQKNNAKESGSTASLAFYDELTEKLYLHNLGDSHTIAFVVDPKTRKVIEKYGTVEHKPNLQEEIQRINQAGGCVLSSNSKSEVPRVAGILALSRAFGDYSLKLPFNKSKGNWVSNIPDTIGPLSMKDKEFYVVSGSDGVFDQLGDEQVINIVLKHKDLNIACSEIVNLAYKKWKNSADNISVVIFHKK